MINFIKTKGWKILCAGYVFIYLPWFFYLEKVFNSEYAGLHILNGPLDDAIPFLEIFIIPYVMWYFYVVGACVFMFFKGTDKEFLQFALSLIIGMSLALLTCMIYPNGVTLRPEGVSDGICGKMVAYLYSIDTSTNVFPSIHAYNSLAVNVALCKCKALKGHNIIKLLSTVLCILICLATMFLKQHSIVDVIGALIYMLVLYIILYVIDYSKIFKKHR